MTMGEVVGYGFWIMIGIGVVWIYASLWKTTITKDKNRRKGHTEKFCSGCRYLRTKTVMSSCVQDDNPEYTITYCVAPNNCIKEEQD